MDWWIGGLMDWWIDGLVDWWMVGIASWLYQARLGWMGLGYQEVVHTAEGGVAGHGG
jgi:hypothetical protein